MQPGLKHREEEIVTPDKTAKRLSSGPVEVYATPMMVLLMEYTCSNCVYPHLDEGCDTVGTKLDVTHVSATPVGMKVWCECELVEVDRRRLVFNVRAFDECGIIGEGSHERFVIDLQKFMEKTNQKLQK